MAKSQIQYGSQGSDVKELQKLLNKNGYKLTEDGIFGINTQKAVRDYQKKMGLDVDGIVGVNTWGSLTGGTSSNANTNSGFSYKDFSYADYTESDTVKQASDALNAQLAQKPGAYQSQWQTQLDDTIKKILNREEFSYDLNGDALYQQYKDKYIQQGKMAMGDAIGQASAMTGGYGNSYAQSVGQQAYQAQLENLNDIVPELYQMAYDKYNQEGQDLYNQYAMLGDRENQDYGRYRDSMADWQTERDYLANRYDAERDFDYSKYADDKNYAYNEYRNKIEDEQWQKQFDEAQRQFNEDMAFQRDQFNYTKSKNSSSGGSSGGSSSGSSGGSGSEGTKNGGSYNNGSLTTDQVKALQKALGVEADGMYGDGSKKAAGGLSAEEAYKKYVGNVGAPSGFTGKTYESAVAYAKSNGVPSSHASGIMTLSEWQRRKGSYKSTGQGGAEVKNYNSYQEYLKDIVEYLVEEYS